MQGAGRKAWPPVVPGGERVERGEEGERDGAEHDDSPPAHPFSFSRRERTKAITVCARAGGMSVGFRVRRVFPVAREVARNFMQGGQASKCSWSSSCSSAGIDPSSNSKRQSRISSLQVRSSCFIPPPPRGREDWRSRRASGGHGAGPDGAGT